MFITESTPGYISVGNQTNALDSITKAADFLEAVGEDLGNWKWFVIAFHHAIYMLMLLALENSDGSGVRAQDDRDEQGLVITVNPRTGLPVPVIPFPKAYKRIKEAGRMGSFVGSVPFAGTKIHDKAMVRINFELRNKLIHLEPVQWGISISYISFCCLDLDDLIVFLSETPQIIWDVNQREQLVDARERITQRLIEIGQ